jgi:E3 ubiquitin-protein ligase HUWE1
MSLDIFSPALSQQSGGGMSGSALGSGGGGGGGGATAESQPPFMRFAERHRRLVNVLVHHKPELLQTSLALLLRAPKLLDFDNK